MMIYDDCHQEPQNKSTTTKQWPPLVALTGGVWGLDFSIAYVMD